MFHLPSSLISSTGGAKDGQPEQPQQRQPLPQDPDTLLAETMNHLSIKEREQVYEDIHGVSPVVEESTEFVKQKLTEMEKSILWNINSPDNSSGNITEQERFAYKLAYRQSPKYCTSPKFRTHFLRTDTFHATKAAVRFIKFFHMKLQLFGPTKLCKSHICINDLTQDDLKCLESGCYQLLPQRDNSGRAVAFAVPYLQQPFTAKVIARVLFYISMRIFLDEETQKRGVVGIIWRTGNQSAGVARFDVIQQSAKMIEVLPLRFVSMHVCVGDSDKIMKTALALHAMVFANNVRTRVRSHIGTNLECKYKLMSYGIPTKLLPFSSGTSSGNSDNKVNDVDLKQHIDFLKYQKNLEMIHLDNYDIEKDDEYTTTSKTTTKNVTSSYYVIVPSNDDVLMGARTKDIMSFPGNVKYRQIVEGFIEEYDKRDRFGKTSLSTQIVTMIKSSGSKFLSKPKNLGIWVELSDDAARDKVAHAFRNYRRSKSYYLNPSSSLSQQQKQRQQQPATKSPSLVSPDASSSTRGGGPAAGIAAVTQHNDVFTAPTFESPTLSEPLIPSILSQTMYTSDDSSSDGCTSFFVGCKRRKVGIMKTGADGRQHLM